MNIQILFLFLLCFWLDMYTIYTLVHSIHRLFVSASPHSLLARVPVISLCFHLFSLYDARIIWIEFNGLSWTMAWCCRTAGKLIVFWFFSNLQSWAIIGIFYLVNDNVASRMQVTIKIKCKLS